MRSAIANANEAAEKAEHRYRSGRFVGKDMLRRSGPTKNRRRVRPAPQGRAYREQRHFCHVTIRFRAKQAEPDEKVNARP